MRSLHRIDWRSAPAVLPDSCERGRGETRGDDRRPGKRRPIASRAAGVSRRGRLSVCLLHFGTDHEQRGVAANESESQSGRDRSISARQRVPLRHASAHHRRRPPGGQNDAGARTMNNVEGKYFIEPERYEFTAAPFHQFELARRDFFKILGAGIAVFAIAKDAMGAQETAPGHGSFHNEELPKDISAWLHIGEDGGVTGFTGKAEIGQNIRTELAQTIADELRVPFESVRMVTADTALTPFDAGTFGSRTTPTITPQLRRVASAARDLLVEVAAKEWNVAPERLKAANARVTDPASGRSLTYAALARGKTLAQNLPAEDPVTPPPDWTIAGKSILKVDARDFVTGRHQYTPDLRPDDMLYGKVLRPPSFGATLTSYDDTAAKSLTGVVIVRDGDFVAAAAPTEREASAALAAIRAQWKQV